MARGGPDRARRPRRGRARARRGARDGRAAAPAVHAARRRALRLDAGAVRRAGWPRPRPPRSARTSGAACSRAAPPRASTASRCSGSVASRAASPSSPPSTRLLAGGERSSGAWRPGLAALLAELGMEDEARRELDARAPGGPRRAARLALGGVADLPGGRLRARSATTTLAALAVPRAGAAGRRQRAIGHGVACYGAADRYLGLLAATLGDHDRAVDHFEQALAVNRGMGATTWVAHTLYAYGRTLRMRGRGDDAVQASALLSEAATLAERIGMPTLLARARALGARHRARPHAAGRPVLARGRHPAARRRGPQQPRDRRGALHQRAHRRQPRAQHPAQDRRREPHGGGRLRLSPLLGRPEPTRGRIAACRCT